MDIRISKVFSTREELDSYVKNRFGDDASKNGDVVMQMDGTEMQKLALDESTTVHGVRVETAVLEGTPIVKSPALGSRVVTVLEKISRNPKVFLKARGSKKKK